MTFRKAEFQPSRASTWLIKKVFKDKSEAKFGDFLEVYVTYVEEKGRTRARIWFWLYLLRSIPKYLKDLVYQGGTLFNNNVKTAIKNITKHKLFSLTNITGLSISMACFILILLYIRTELSFDTYHPDSDRIFRIAVEKKNNSSTRTFAINAGILAPTLKEQYPEVEEAGRIMMLPADTYSVKYKDNIFYENRVGYADNGFLNIFSLTFIRGDARYALETPNSVILTRSMLRKYLGAVSPIGEIIEINNEKYTITGIIENLQPNTHLKFDFLVSFKKREDLDYMKNWHFLPCYTYVKLARGVGAEDFEKKIRHIAHKYIGEELETMGIRFSYFLQPIQQIHLRSQLLFEAEPAGNVTNIYTFSAIGILILLIGCINFVNLTSARSYRRFPEVGIKKVLGARRKQIFGQLLQESLVLSFVSLFCACLLVLLFLPQLNILSGTLYKWSDLFQPDFIPVLISIALFTGIASGCYPAFSLSKFGPTNMIKGSNCLKSGRSLTRNMLVVGQFAMSISIIIGSVIVQKQVEFMKNKNLGFDLHQKLIVKINPDSQDNTEMTAIKSGFTSHTSVFNASASRSVPGRSLFTKRLAPVGDTTKGQSVKSLNIDHDFFRVYNIDIISGRSFRPTDNLSSGHIINEAAVEFFGFSSAEEAVGQDLLNFNDSRLPIIGVTRNFHWRGLQKRIEPLVMTHDTGFSYMTFTLKPENIAETLLFIKNQYLLLFPETPFEYFFLDSDFNQQYKTEEIFSRIIAVFTIISMFIACLGLWGLTTFTAERRRKEIGIRKVLGASVFQLLSQLTIEFMKWVLLGMIFAWAGSYIVLSRWVKNFAFRVTIGFSELLFPGLIALLIALLTIFIYSFKAARENPVKSLRYE